MAPVVRRTWNNKDEQSNLYNSTGQYTRWFKFRFWCTGNRLTAGDRLLLDKKPASTAFSWCVQLHKFVANTKQNLNENYFAFHCTCFWCRPLQCWPSHHYRPQHRANLRIWAPTHLFLLLSSGRVIVTNVNSIIVMLLPSTNQTRAPSSWHLKFKFRRQHKYVKLIVIYELWYWGSVTFHPAIVL